MMKKIPPMYILLGALIALGVVIWTIVLMPKGDKSMTIPKVEITTQPAQPTIPATKKTGPTSEWLTADDGTKFAYSNHNKISLAILSKGFRAADIYSGEFDDYIVMDFLFRNNTTKEVKGVQGALVFYNIFDNEIFRTSINYDEGIPASGSSKIWESGIKYNQFIDSHQTLRATEYDNLKFKWEPTKIVYADGTTKEL